MNRIHYQRDNSYPVPRSDVHTIRTSFRPFEASAGKFAWMSDMRA